MIVSNIAGVGKFLKQECADESTSTPPLTVESVGDDYVIVTSSHDSDLSIKLRGITDVAVGATLAVAIDSGEVTIMSAFDPNKYLFYCYWDLS